MKIMTEQLKNNLPEIKPGCTVIVYQKIKEGDKERIQPFEGLVIAKKHGSGINATITVRKISGGIAVERIFPIHSPSVEKIKVAKKSKVRRAKLYYLRGKFGKQAKMKKTEVVVPETIIKEEAPIKQ
jgi:large subunit ribosomal protein L19